jgi:hypothetical protein
MGKISSGEQAVHHQMEKRTAASVWQAVAGSPVTDELLEWPPDLFALTDVILARSEAYRFALSPPGGRQWPPVRFADWSGAVVKAGRQWSAWAEDRRGPVPDLLAEEWSVVREHAGMPLEQLADGSDWRMCEALLTLHAIADEACAGLGVALDRSDGDGCLYRARGRELLARTGSLARIHADFVRVLPKVRTPLGGTNLSSFSRYACVLGPGVAVRWYRLPARRRGTDPWAEHTSLLLLPWPLQVRESDFRVLEGSVQRLAKEPFGFFEFAPSESLDLDLVDRLLAAALDETDSVDVVVLPEGAIDETDIGPLEALLDQHQVAYLLAGVREGAPEPGRPASNWMHAGVNPRLEKGGPQPGSGTRWFHMRQNKHHRWSLDEQQIYQYHLGGALHPHIRWWEAMEVPPRTIGFMEAHEITMVSLVCEDLAQSDNVAQVIQSVGPTLLVTPLLDGPQLTSRWSARYASVFADDPGSAVLTLTSYGMVQRSRPPGFNPSSVVALWKDAARGAREIPLEPGAQGVLLTACADRATRRSADGRWPVDNATDYFDVAVHQVRVPAARPQAPYSPARKLAPSVLDAEELSILAGWAAGTAEALAHAPGRALALLADARPGAPWRAALAIAEPSPRVIDAIESLAHVVQAHMPADETAAFDAVIIAAREEQPGEQPLDSLTRRVLLSVLEQLRARQAREADDERPGGPNPARLSPQ